MPLDAPTAALPQVSRHSFLGTHVDAYTLSSFLDTVGHTVHRSKPYLVANHNVNSLALLQKDSAFAALYDEADGIFIDGTPVVPLARALGADVGMDNRIAVLDWIWPLFARAERNSWKIVHLGGSGPVLERARRAAWTRHPNLSLTTIDGYFEPHDAEQNDRVLAQIQSAEPDVLLVGMGMPRQEKWLKDNLSRLPPCTVITVGGILGYLGGDRPTAPRWLGPLGLEWLFRLVTEPRRLWRRYMIEPLVLLPMVARGLFARLERFRGT